MKKLMLVGGVALSATLVFGEAVPQISPTFLIIGKLEKVSAES